MVVCVVCLVIAFLLGGIPFGLLIAKGRGVDLRTVGSGNIGATNVGRALGRKFGLLTFALDFLKGALPVAVVVPLARLIDASAPQGFGGPDGPDVLRVATAFFAFLGHVFPVYLKFQGGKGVATGAGVMAVLVPWPFAVAVLTWVAVLWATRYVSAASITCVVVLLLARLIEVTARSFGRLDRDGVRAHQRDDCHRQASLQHYAVAAGAGKQCEGKPEPPGVPARVAPCGCGQLVRGQSLLQCDRGYADL